MAIIKSHSETCEVTQENSGKSITAVVTSFNEGKSLSVILNKSVKLSMNWNGTCYEGRMAGMDFVSPGPTISTIQSRGR